MLLGAVTALAVKGAIHHTFEPTDLELEDPGVAQVDLQVGYLRGLPDRTLAPDLELDLGLTEDVELDVDATLFVVAPDLRVIDAENLWIASKLGLWDSRDRERGTAWALGVQLGPKLPVARGAHGLGYEALALLGRTVGSTHVVANLGGLVDPGDHVGPPRPVALEGGLDLELPFAAVGVQVPKLALLGEVGALHYFSLQPDAVTVTLGPQWSISDALDVSVVGLAGVLSTGDRWGVMLGFAPKLALW